ncbi:MAG: serpin family protein [Candidatus Saccharibacteria bacterium]|nr:serpin family protein [Candidatus Saccharibacteria bacterium]
MDNYNNSNANNSSSSTPPPPPTPDQIQRQYQQPLTQSPSQSTFAQNQNSKNASKFILFFIVAIAILAFMPVVFALWTYFSHNLTEDGLNPSQTFHPVDPSSLIKSDSFEFDFIKTANADKAENYLISPYSIKTALQLLNEGADGETKSEIESALRDDTTPLDLSSEVLKVANAAFIAPRFSKSVKPDFTDILATKYNSEILSADSPDVINNWVNKNTDGMIPKIIQELPPGFTLGLSNAIALDAKWMSEFEPELTTKKPFTISNGDKVETDIMTKTSTSSETTYFELHDGKGITKAYDIEPKICDDVHDTSLIGPCPSRLFEFVAILPDSSPDDFIDNMPSDLLTEIDFKKIPASDEVNVITHLPKFTFDYDLSTFKDNLKSLGINSAFDSKGADFSNISDEQIYVDSTIHKTHIELSESGTKAAAVTYFGMRDNAVPSLEKQPTIYEISFDRPFLFFIRDAITNEVVFFGVIENPSA